MNIKTRLILWIMKYISWINFSLKYKMVRSVIDHIETLSHDKQSEAQLKLTAFLWPKLSMLVTPDFSLSEIRAVINRGGFIKQRYLPCKIAVSDLPYNNEEPTDIFNLILWPSDSTYLGIKIKQQHIRFTPRAKLGFRLAAIQSVDDGINHIGPDNIFISMLKASDNKESRLYKLLIACGIQPEQLLTDLLREYNKKTS